MIVFSWRRARNALARMVCVGLIKTLLPWRTVTTTMTTSRKQLAQEIYVDVQLVLHAGLWGLSLELAAVDILRYSAAIHSVSQAASWPEDTRWLFGRVMYRFWPADTTRARDFLRLLLCVWRCGRFMDRSWLEDTRWRCGRFLYRSWPEDIAMAPV